MDTSSWLIFGFSALFVCALLFAPGAIALVKSPLGKIEAVACAPLVSLLFICVAGSVLFFLGISTTWWQLLAIVLFIALCIAACLAWKDCHSLPSRHMRRMFEAHEIAILLVFIVIAGVVTSVFYVKTLDGPDSFVTLYDNAFHLNLIRSFERHGFYSPFASNIDFSSGISIFGVGFYPAMLHSVSALAASAFGVSPALALNSSIAVSVCIVYPVGLYAFLRKISGGNRIIMLCGAMLSLAFGAYPWRLFQWGPLYSNVMAYALIPSFLICFMAVFDETGRKRLAYAVLSVIGIFAMAVTQTNADFTAAVILIPYCVYKIYSIQLARSKKIAMFSVAGFLAFVVVFWLFLYYSPYFSAVVSYTWPPVSSTSQSIVNLVNLSFTGGMAQPVLSALVLVGICVVLIKWSNLRWAIASYFLLSAIYLASSSTDGLMQHVLSGFWYTDSNRVAASIVLIAAPLASFGLAEIAEAIARCAKRAGSCYIEKGLPALAVISLTGLIFLPNYYIAGITDVTTSFGATGDYLTKTNMLAAGFSLSKDELEFADKVWEVTGPDAVVLNNPFDGSVFLYASNNINVFFKSFIAFGEDDSAGKAEERVLRRDAVNYVSSSETSQLMKELGVQYVIQLDAGGWGSLDSTFDNNYSERLETYFEGVQSIDESTPGFSLVLSSGDMRLYRVEY